ncbi:hypothetical protein TH606_10215 [Thermodesulfatator autotrophicus]|uniref:Uncharacterized protein n=1 Tax=Thermodesulfatator autotrophicus TaxID=1795632 RepID=A0A177E4W0_9BACT|nr:hypothetical protein TH606_10215 [Thermodesulfatator autotrophicus]
MFLAAPHSDEKGYVDLLLPVIASLFYRSLRAKRSNPLFQGLAKSDIKVFINESVKQMIIFGLSLRAKRSNLRSLR